MKIRLKDNQKAVGSTPSYLILFSFLDFIDLCNDCIISYKDFLSVNWSSMVVILW